MAFKAEELPPIHDPEFLEISNKERGMLSGRGPTCAQLQQVLQHPAFRHLMAETKNMARTNANQFFSGDALPRGLETASPREAYFTGLVNAIRGVLDLQRKMWEKAQLRERQEKQEANPEPRETEEDPFGTSLPVTNSQQGEPS